MLELIKYIVGNLVDEPEKIEIVQTGDEYKVFVPKAEIGKVIGKQGKVAKAIRTVVRAAAGESVKVGVDIVEA